MFKFQKAKRIEVIDCEYTLNNVVYQGVHYECPRCGAHLLEVQERCECGQKIDIEAE